MAYGYGDPIFTNQATDWVSQPYEMPAQGEGGTATTIPQWYSKSLNTITPYDPATGMDSSGQYQRYTPQWYDQTNGAGSYDAAVKQYAPQIGTQDPAKFFANLWQGGDAMASAQQAQSGGFLDKFMGGIADKLNPVTGMLAVLTAGLAGGAFGAMGAAGGEAAGAAGSLGGDAGMFGGLADLEAANPAMYGQAAGEAAATGGGMWDFDFGDIFDNSFGGPDTGVENTISGGGSQSSYYLDPANDPFATQAGQNASTAANSAAGSGMSAEGYPSGGYPGGAEQVSRDIAAGNYGSGSGSFRLPSTGKSLVQGGMGGNGSNDPNGLNLNKLINGLISGGISVTNQRSLEDKYSGLRDTINANQFPFKDFQDMAYKFKDPQQRYQMMLDNPGYLASRDYVQKAQTRRNAHTGDLKSGYGDSILADVIGKNAQNWDSQNFEQTKAMSGMGFNNASAQALLAQILPQIYKGRQETAMTAGNAVQDSNLIPWLLNTVFGGDQA